MNNLSLFPDILSLKDLARYLKVSTKTASKFIRKNKIKYCVVGREYRISKLELGKYLGVND